MTLPFSHYSTPRNGNPLAPKSYGIALPPEIRQWAMDSGADVIRNILHQAMVNTTNPVTASAPSDDTSIVVTGLPEQLVTWMNFKGEDYIRNEVKFFFEQQHKCWLGDDD